MTIRTIEVPSYAGLDLAHLLDAALALARPFGAHIDVTCVVPDAAAELAMLPPLAVGGGIYAIPEFERMIEANRARQQTVFEAWCQHNGIGQQTVDHRLDSVFARWRQECGAIEAVVMRTGRLADLTVIRRPGSGDVAAGRCFDTAVFATGRPALVVSDTLPARLLSHVVIAWNGSLEATHAVAQTMPILHEAEQVSIFTAPRHNDTETPDLDLASALRWHGIEARCLRPKDGATSVGASLLAAAHDHEASLIVMGAYTHSRVREVLLGGVTRDILRNAPIPVIMAH